MKCILVNENMPEVEITLDEDTATILKVMKIYEFEMCVCFELYELPISDL